MICLVGLILYSKKKDREEAQNGAGGKSTDGFRHMTCSGDCSKCFGHCDSRKYKTAAETVIGTLFKIRGGITHETGNG